MKTSFTRNKLTFFAIGLAALLPLGSAWAGEDDDLIVVPIRLCVLGEDPNQNGRADGGERGALSFTRPDAFGQPDAASVALRRLQDANDLIWTAGAKIVFQSAGPVAIIPDPSPSVRGEYGDLIEAPGFESDEELDLYNSVAKKGWEDFDKKSGTISKGPVVIFVRAFVTSEPQFTPRTKGEAFGSTHAFLQDNADRFVVAHELGHLLSLTHGDGLDNNNNGTFDEYGEVNTGSSLMTEGNSAISGSIVMTSLQKKKARSCARQLPGAKSFPAGSPLPSMPGPATFSFSPFFDIVHCSGKWTAVPGQPGISLYQTCLTTQPATLALRDGTSLLDIPTKYARLGGINSFLGAVASSIAITPDWGGLFQHYQNGSIYWTLLMGAHEVHGAIRGKWSSLGWERSFLGFPATDEIPVLSSFGNPAAFNHFQGGSIFWSAATGAHFVRAAIRAKWASLGWERSSLGLPMTDEAPIVGFYGDQGAYSHFQGGSIYWSPGTGARALNVAIRAKWAALGWERSFLGFPMTDGVPIVSLYGDPGLFTHFQGGSIYWSSATGAHTVYGGIRAKWAELGWERGLLGYPITDEIDWAGERLSAFEGGYITCSVKYGTRVTFYPRRTLVFPFR